MGAFRSFRQHVLVSSVLFGLLGLTSAEALAQTQPLERFCDSSIENCRTVLYRYIDAETERIDVATWFFEDSRISTRIINRKNAANIQVRVIGDTRAADTHPANEPILNSFVNAGIPVRNRIHRGIEHWKLMIFASQNIVYFGSANFSEDAFVPHGYGTTSYVPYSGYVDETIYFTGDLDVVNSFKRKFDDTWMNTVDYVNLGNAPNSSLARAYDLYPVDQELNFAPATGSSSYRSRSVAAYNAETQGIDIIMYRLTDQAHVDAVINRYRQNVPVRLYHEQQMYRGTGSTNFIWHAMSVDKMYAAGIPIRERNHGGSNHKKLVLLHGQQMTVFGSSNWTSASSDRQHEHNYFTTKPAAYDYYTGLFERKWNNSVAQETKAFEPLPPDRPSHVSPANSAVSVATTGTRLRWYGGPWAHLYDIYFGTSPTPPLFAENVALGPSQTTSMRQEFNLPALAPGTTYYWRIRSKTLAGRADLDRWATAVWSFTTAGTAAPPPAGAEDVVLWPTDATVIQGDWEHRADASAAGGRAIYNPDRGRAKVAAAAAPANYFEMSFNALSGVPYHLWIRMKATSISNDSVYVQFDSSVDAVGTAIARIGTTNALDPVLQDGSGGAFTAQSWGWTDNGWGTVGANIYFSGSGTRTIRIQQREDGPFIDQIVLSPSRYISSPPPAATILPRSGGTTGGGTTQPPPPPPSLPSGTVVIWTANISASNVYGNWSRVSYTTAAGGSALHNPNNSVSKIAPALVNPASYFEGTFAADAGRAYHVWVRMRAVPDSTANDSVHLQFNDSLNSSGAAYARIGTTSSAEFVLQAGPSGAAPQGWGWTENGWETLGPHIYFATTGLHTFRVQQREDGPAIDQIVLTPDLTWSPGARRNDATIWPSNTSGSTSNPPPTTSPDTVVLWASSVPAAQVVGDWIRVTDASAAGGAALLNPDRGRAKIAPALAAPVNYFDVTFDADAGRAYHVWVRMRADQDSWSNDSIHLQFDGAVTGSGTPYARIGTNESAEVVLQNGPSGAEPSGWGWTENGWGALGTHVYFQADGEHTVRIQQREDGAIVDQIMLSPTDYLTRTPGQRLNDSTIHAQNEGTT